MYSQIIMFDYYILFFSIFFWEKFVKYSEIVHATWCCTAVYLQYNRSKSQLNISLFV